ncbi:MAG: hypothetical protein WCP09_00650 [Candidatus Taylorbacteria bacterium]
MIKLKVIKLGTVCKDNATDLNGTVTHWICNMGKRIDYLFQPPGTNPDDGQPLKKIILEEERLKLSDDQFEEVEIPFEILGTEVINNASGFNGMAVEFVRHVNGCFHVVIQPKGVLRKTNSPIHKAEFDLRECSGKMIAKMNEEELKKSKEKNPSPTNDSFEKWRPIANSTAR